MKKISRILSIIIAVFVLNFTPFISISNASPITENIVAQYELKDKVYNFLLYVGQTVLHNLKNETATINNSYTNSKALNGKTIVIDPGHGGYNPGAVRFGFREADNNLAVAEKTAELLRRQGANVIMTRKSDISLTDKSRPLRDELQTRVDIAKQNDADIFVSIHTNSSESSNIQGAMTFYYDEASKPLAHSIQNYMVKSSQAVDKGIAYGNFLVLRNSDIPAVLVEMGFISNEQEARRLNQENYRTKLAQGITDGINDYFKNSTKY